MSGIRIQFRTVAFGQVAYKPLLSGEPVFDPVTQRFGIGIGGVNPIWYPKGTVEGNLQFDTDTGLVSSDGTYALKFTTNNVSWQVSGSEVLATRGSTGVALKNRLVMLNSSGADVVTIGYGHLVAIFAMLTNIKALLRKIVAGTATLSDVNALLTPDPSYNLPNLDPSFPEAPAL